MNQNQNEIVGSQQHLPEKLRSDFNHRKEFEKVLEIFSISKNKTCVIGSVALNCFGIRENRDVDFLVTPEVRERIREQIKHSPELSKKFNLKSKGRVGFSNGVSLSEKNRLGFMGISDRELIENERYYYNVDGFKILRLELVIAKKHALGRPKDKHDIKLIEESGIIGSSTWDWDLFQPLPPWERPRKALWKRSIKSLFNKGIIKTLKKIVVRFSPKIFDWLRWIENFGDALHLARVQDELEIRITTAQILNSYYRQGEFRGWNFVIEYDLVAENNLINENELTSFRSEFNIPTDEKEIVINGRKKIVQGQTKFVKHLQKRTPQISVKVSSASPDVVGDINWLKRVALNDQQMEKVRMLKNNLYEKQGAFFYAFLWPPAVDIFNQIEDYLSDYFSIVRTEQYQVGNGFEAFFRELYNFDDSTKDWLIEKKYRLINSPEKLRFRVLVLEVYNQKLAGKFSNREDQLVRKITEIKNKCRSKFQNKMEPYVFDNMLHITDNYKQNYVVYGLLKQLTGTKKIFSNSPNKEDLPDNHE